MLARGLAGCVALAGCFSPATPSGAPCADVTSAARCPSGQVCVLQGGLEVCEAPGTLDDACVTCGPSDAQPDVQLSGNDSDQDTIDDAIDNCPMKPNTDQANEDGDATGDACDKCPPDVDTGADADDDGVGDACDPDPAVGGDTIVAFHTFMSAPAGWTSEGGGTVTFSGGDARLNGSGGLAIFATASPGSGNVEVRAAVTPESVGGGFVGIITQHASMTDLEIACQLSNSDVRLYDSSSGGIIDPVAFTVQTGTRYELRARRRGTQFQCRASSPNTISMGTATYNPPSPEVGLRARTAVARYHWVMIISSP